MSGYSIVRADDVEDAYAGSDVPGEFRSLKQALGAEQIAVTLIRVPPHSDFEQGTGHFHEELEEIYIVTRGRGAGRDLGRVAEGRERGLDQGLGLLGVLGKRFAVLAGWHAALPLYRRTISRSDGAQRVESGRALEAPEFASRRRRRLG